MTANRTKIVRVRLTPEQHEALEKKIQRSDFKDVSKCMRALIAGYVKGYSGLDQLHALVLNPIPKFPPLLQRDA